MKPIQVWLFDDEHDQLDVIEDALLKIFGNANIKVEIKKFSTDDSKKLIKHFEKDRPEVFIVDNHVGESIREQMYGQNIIKELKPLFPDSVFILLTKNNIRADSLDKKFPLPDLLLRKYGVEAGSHEYTEWIVAAIGAKIRRARITRIDTTEVHRHFSKLRSRSKVGSRHRITEAEIRSLIEQVCFTGGMPQDNVIEEVKLSPLVGGKSDAVVCVISVQNKYGDFQVPAVIKFMPIEQAQREAHNHAKFVKWVLPYRWRVDVIGKGVTGRFGAVCYSFAHGGAGAPETLTDLLRNNERDRVLKVMSDIFNPESKAWYSKVRTSNEPLVISLSKTPPYFFSDNDQIKREEQILEQVEFISEHDGVRIIGDGGNRILQIADYNFPLGSILDQILQIRDIDRTDQCLSHGGHSQI